METLFIEEEHPCLTDLVEKYKGKEKTYQFVYKLEFVDNYGD